MAVLPSRIRVGPFWYRVSADPQELREWEHDGTQPDHIHGGCHNARLFMLVDTTFPRGQQRDTLWHEVKHAINYLADVGGEDKLGEEEMVGRTSTLELMVLRDNPELVAFLLAEDGE